MTTASRASTLLGNALIDAARPLTEDLENNPLSALEGKTYRGRFVCDWTTAPDVQDKSGQEEAVIHYSYGYAAQLCVLDGKGEIEAIYAAHDAGKVINPVLFSGQIEGAVHMGLGYALTEDLPMEGGRLISDRLSDCGVLRVHETPRIHVIPVEVEDPVGPYGAKGVGEIGLVPTAPAVANALYAFDGTRRYSLPMKRKRRRAQQSGSGRPRGQGTS
jgi:CO/xanthine dehydrogenase Mo-binding subunit